MEYSVYILYSAQINRYYTGSTDDVQRRLIEHNEGKYGGSFTSKGMPWVLFLTIEGLSSAQAYGIESHIKRMKSRKYIENLKEHPTIIEKLNLVFHPKQFI